jgi:serine/threonine protein kinase
LFSTSELLQKLREMVTGISYLHSNKICHRDIKPENFLVFEFEHIKLTDLGNAKYLSNEEELEEGVFVEDGD